MRVASARIVLLILLAAGAAARAQDIEPRLYSNIPQGMNFVIAAYAHAAGALATDPTLPLEDGELSTDGLVLAYARVIAVHGQSGKIDVVWPYMWLDGSAVYAGEPAQRRVAGSGDPRVRVSFNLYGAPALDLKDFAAYQQGTIVGCSVQMSLPLGQYDDTRVVNLGANRLWIKPEVGVSHATGRWTFELAGGATIYGDNDDFLNGQVRSKDPVYSVAGGVIYGFPRGAWLALHGTWYTGGRTAVDGVEGNDLQRNSLVGLTAALPINRKDSVKFYASKGVSTRIGSDVDTISVAWQHRWGGGL